MKEDEEFYEKLKKKLNNKRIAKQLSTYRDKIESLMDCAVEFSFISAEEMEENDAIKNQMLDDIELVGDIIGSEEIQTGLTLGQLKEILETEDQDKNVFIDPIYLSKGMKPLGGLLVVGMDQHVILIPKSEETNNDDYKK